MVPLHHLWKIPLEDHAPIDGFLIFKLEDVFVQYWCFCTPLEIHAPINELCLDCCLPAHLI